MIGIHPKAHAEHLATIRYMVENHYDRRAIAQQIEDIEAIFAEIDEAPNPRKVGKPETWGPYEEARYCGPTTYGFRVRFLPEYNGRPVVLAVVDGRRHPATGSRRKPI